VDAFFAISKFSYTVAAFCGHASAVLLLLLLPPTLSCFRGLVGTDGFGFNEPGLGGFGLVEGPGDIVGGDLTASPTFSYISLGEISASSS